LNLSYLSHITFHPLPVHQASEQKAEFSLLERGLILNAYAHFLYQKGEDLPLY
jgi:hypothetical protein